VAEVESFNEVQPGTLEFALAWSRQDAKRAEAERARRLGVCVNLDYNEDDDAGPSWRRGGSNGDQGCSTWVPKDEPSDNKDDDNDGGDYSVFYRHLGMN
jgi:hypothetical protein